MRAVTETRQDSAPGESGVSSRQPHNNFIVEAAFHGGAELAEGWIFLNVDSGSFKFEPAANHNFMRRFCVLKPHRAKCGFDLLIARKSLYRGSGGQSYVNFFLSNPGRWEKQVLCSAAGGGESGDVGATHP